MATSRKRNAQPRSLGDWLPIAAIGIAWFAVVSFLFSTHGFRGGFLVVALVAAALGLTLTIRRPGRAASMVGADPPPRVQLAMLAEDPSRPLELTAEPELGELNRALDELRRSWLEADAWGPRRPTTARCSPGATRPPPSRSSAPR